MTKIIFENKTYCVSLSPICGLVIENKKIKNDLDSKRGFYLKPEHPQFKEWLNAFETSMDSKESQALSKAFLRGAI